MNFTKSILIVIVTSILFLYSTANAQDKALELEFRKINVEDGLSQNSVLSITQDKNGVMWFGTRDGVNEFDGNRIKHLQIEEDTNGQLGSNDYARSLLCDQTGDLWIGTAHGLIHHDRSKKKTKRITSSNNVLSHNLINQVIQTNNGEIWVATKAGLNRLINRKTAVFQQFLKSQTIYALAEGVGGSLFVATSEGLLLLSKKNDKYQIDKLTNVSRKVMLHKGDHITYLRVYNKTLWIATAASGLWLWDVDQDKFMHYHKNASDTHRRLIDDQVRTLLVDRKERVWVGTFRGISILQSDQKSPSKHFVHHNNNEKSLSHNSVYSIYEDVQGIIWIGTYYGGVNIAYPNDPPFKLMNSVSDGVKLSSDIISAIEKGDDDNIWIGTEAEGLDHYDRKNGKIANYHYEEGNSASINSNLVKALLMDHNKKLWVGTHRGGLDRFVPATKSFQHITFMLPNDSIVGEIDVNAISEDRNKKIWVGTNRGLWYYDREKNVVRQFMSSDKAFSALSRSIIQCLFEDDEGQLWVGAIGSLYRINAERDQIKSFRPNEYKTMSSSNINCILQTSDGKLWFASHRGGLMYYEKSNDTFRNLGVQDGLPSNNILGLVEDENKALWMSTDNGLSRYDISNRTMRTFQRLDGLPGNVFNQRSYFKTNDGYLYFGGFSGLVSFHPSRFVTNEYSPRVLFTGLRIFDKEINLSDSEFESTCENGDYKLVLPYDLNVITLEFSYPNYLYPEKNKFAFLLEGIDQKWVETDQPNITYHNLPFGEYRLLIRAANADGVWSSVNTRLIINITPPWYKSVYAYSVYVIAVLAFIFAIIRHFILRDRLEKENEFYQAKVDFFTEVSHEVRTPLTLITGPLEDLLDVEQDQEKLNILQGVRENANRLLRLVSELLDFRKVESGLLKIRVEEVELNAYVSKIYSLFIHKASQIGIGYSLTKFDNLIFVNIDVEQMEKAIVNLISNALKFVSAGGNVSIAIEYDNDRIVIIVRNTGEGIKKEQKPYLFDLFYRGDSSHTGWGVGLALSKKIVDLHGGSLTLESEDSNLTIAKIFLPLEKVKTGEHFSFVKQHIPYDQPLISEPQMTIVNHRDELDSKGVTEHSLILVVEDNDEMRNYVMSCLSKDFEVLTSTNGTDGLKAACEHIPDLIVTDIMMPGLDGYELCEALKSNSLTDHIPVLMLTARTDTKEHLQGVSAGADSYLPKPFNTKVLLGTIHNLLRVRRTLQLKYSQKLKLGNSTVSVDDKGQIFLSEIVSYVELNISDGDLSVPDISQHMGMSQPVLYKKVRAITGMTVNDFINTVRLKIAAKMLENSADTNISQIAYATGFTSPKYFTKKFKEQFGVSPSRYLKK